MFVSTTKPKEAVQTMNTLLARVRVMELSEKGLREMKSGYITSNYTKQQSSAAMTASLGRAEILGGWQYEDSLPSLIDNVTVDGIKVAFNKYIVGLRWSYLGNQVLADQAADAFKQPLK
jgi:zinc protease